MRRYALYHSQHPVIPASMAPSASACHPARTPIRVPSVHTPVPAACCQATSNPNFTPGLVWNSPLAQDQEAQNRGHSQ